MPAKTCQAWRYPALRIACENEGLWRPVALLHASLERGARNPAGDVAMPLKVNLVLCDEHKKFDWDEFFDKPQSSGKTAFETIRERMAAEGKARPVRARSEFTWEPASRPFESAFQAS